MCPLHQQTPPAASLHSLPLLMLCIVMSVSCPAVRVKLWCALRACRQAGCCRGLSSGWEVHRQKRSQSIWHEGMLRLLSLTLGWGCAGCGAGRAGV